MAEYFKEAFDSSYRKLILKQARALKKAWAYDTVVVRGVSGLVVGPLIAHVLDCNLYVIRKPGESSHSCAKYAGECGYRPLIVDDFAATGCTIRTIKAELDRPPVGILFYAQRDCFNSNYSYALIHRVPVASVSIRGLHVCTADGKNLFFANRSLDKIPTLDHTKPEVAAPSGPEVVAPSGVEISYKSVSESECV